MSTVISSAARNLELNGSKKIEQISPIVEMTQNKKQ